MSREVNASGAVTTKMSQMRIPTPQMPNCIPKRRQKDGGLAARLEDFLGAIVNIYGPRMLRYKGVLNMEGTERKVIFQGVHQLMGSDLGPAWADGEQKTSKMVFIGIDLPKDIFLQGLEQCLV